MEPNNAAQAMWRLLEPYHAVTYFAPEAREELEAVGLEGFWRGYFAARLAPLGAVDATTSIATLYVFAPSMVERAVPDVWARATPDEALGARLRGARRALDGVVEAGDAIGEAAELAERAASRCAAPDRPLASANLALGFVDDPVLRLWQAATVLREHRGDGHVATLRAAGVDPCGALVLHAATGVPETVHLRDNRGWTADEWRAAAGDLEARGWLDGGGTLTVAGADARRAIERDTDARAAAAYDALDVTELDRLAATLRAVVERIAQRGIVPYPNPMGVPRP